MSRAFVKEIDEAEVPLPERAVSLAPNRVTLRGVHLIEREIDRLEHQLAIDPKAENLRLLRRDLRYWQARHATMEVMQPDAEPETIVFGTTVRIRRADRESTVTIVGEDEADPASGLIAWTSPLARALDGAEAGESVELAAAGRNEKIEILAVTLQSSTL